MSERDEKFLQPTEGSTGGPPEQADEELLRVKESLEQKTRDLAYSLALMRATLEATNDGILVTDRERHVLAYNTHFAELWHIPPHILNASDDTGLVEHVLHQLVDPQQFLERIEAVYNSSTESFDEIRRIDGTILERYSRIQYVDGQGVGRVWSFRDVTQQRNAEELRWRLAEIVESSNDAIISATLDGMITTWNAAAERMLEYAPEEIIGKSVMLLYPPDRKDDEAHIMGRIRHGERVANYETQRVAKSGNRVYVSLSVSPVRDAEGRVIGMSKIARDITQQRRNQEALQASEAKLRAMFDATPECVNIIAPDGRVTFINRAGIAMIEVGEAIIGQSMLDVIAPEYRQDWNEHHKRVCQGERLTWQFEVLAPGGTRCWLETHAVPLELPDEGYTAQLAVSRDITGRKVIELEREQLLASERSARSQAERASQLKDEFLATLSHELRTPLNAIVGWSQILSMETPSESELQEGLEAIERNARAQARIIEDLLDMSRIISGKVHLDVHPVDLSSVIESALVSVRPSADAKEIILRKVLDSRAGPVAGDATRLQQVVWNLLSNAVKFTPKQGKIDVYLERVNSHLEITVRDSGIGIPPEYLPVVFERFRQVDSSSTRTFGGLGLGLSIAKSLVELHGGTISVHSEGEGRGATFTVALPLAPVKSAASREHPAARNLASLSHDLDLSGVKVLVVDDEADARVLISRMLEGCGAEVETAPTADTALSLIESFEPHVLVSDIGMPHKDGYQFMEEVRALPDNQGGRIPALALTAFARSEDRTRAMMAGYQVHMSKPIEAYELAATVANLAGRVGHGRSSNS